MATPLKAISGDMTNRIEIVCWIVMISVANIPLFTGSFSDLLVFYPDPVATGQWWRTLTFPLVHVSYYHLFLDALAFLLLWRDMRTMTSINRWSLLAFCWGMSLALPLLLSSRLEVHGLCGLSGIGHGLFVFYALDSARRAKMVGDRLLYLVSLLMAGGLILKSALETLWGNYFFASLHLGEIGIPIVEAHLGGAVAGVSAFLASRFTEQTTPRKR